MRDDIVQSYEGYREEDRLTTNNARRIEFITTVRVLDEWLKTPGDLLDCAAGTGVYAHYYAAKGHRVTALDLTPRHVEIMRDSLAGKPYTMDVDVNDATDLSRFADGSFDAVLCMGPLYHLTEEADRRACMAECARVLRPGGLLAVAYISRFYVFPYIALKSPAYMNPSFCERMITTGIVKADDADCFWTDTNYSTPKEMERLLVETGAEVVDHFAADGLSPMLKEQVDALDAEAFAVWCEYQYQVCRETSLLGATNHGMVIGRKL